MVLEKGGQIFQIKLGQAVSSGTDPVFEVLPCPEKNLGLFSASHL